MARPQKHGEKRIKKIVVYVTPSEFIQIETDAAQTSLSHSEFFRYLWNKYHKEKP